MRFFSAICYNNCLEMNAQNWKCVMSCHRITQLFNKKQFFFIKNTFLILYKVYKKKKTLALDLEEFQVRIFFSWRFVTCISERISVLFKECTCIRWRNLLNSEMRVKSNLNKRQLQNNKIIIQRCLQIDYNY